MDKLKIRFLGTRGSIPACGENYNIYGGNTTCLLIEVAGQVIIIDGGTGILNVAKYLPPETKNISLLLTHAHIDHILGFTVCPQLFSGKIHFDVMGTELFGLSVKQQIQALMHEPLWPIDTSVFGNGVSFSNLESDCFMLGGVKIETIDGSHPGNALIYKISSGGKTFVFCTDFEHDDSAAVERLIKFAHDTDLLIFDGHYSDEEYLQKKGWGHSTWQEGAKIAARCGAKKLVLTHHAPMRTDEELALFEKQVKKINPAYLFAKAEQLVEI